MRRSHFEAFGPVCPLCRQRTGLESPLRIGRVLQEEGAHILEGLLLCGEPSCQREYPIIDGIPMLVPDIRSFVQHNLYAITQRDDLHPVLDGLLGDCAGQGSEYDSNRQYLSSYSADHYDELDPTPPRDAAPSAAVRMLRRGLELAGPVHGPVLELGCSVGRVSFELAAASEELVLGMDLGFAMLRMASRVLRDGRVRYPRRRGGLVYEWRSFQHRFHGSERLDFWLADANSPPLPAGRFGLAVSLNLLDCVASPGDHLAAVGALLDPHGKAIVGSPYDWSTTATPLEHWLGGHSQRGPDGGDSRSVVHRLLEEEPSRSQVGLEVLAEDPRFPWRVRVHDRSVMQYESHLLALRKRHSTPPAV